VIGDCMDIIIIGLIVITLIITVWWLVCLFWLKPWNIKHLYMRLFWQMGSNNPELLTMIGLLEKFGIHGHNSRLADVSEANLDRNYTLLEGGLKLLRSYARHRQTPATLLSTDILDWFMDDQYRSKPFRHHDYPFNQMFGMQSETPNFMMTIHPLGSRRDAKDYIKRLEKIGLKFDQALVGVHIREEKGCIPPRFVIRRILDEMIGFIGKPASENELYTVFSEKVSKLKLGSKQTDQLLDSVKARINQFVYPAYQRLIAYFTDLEQKAGLDDGVWRLPDGEAYYAHLLRSNTTTDMPAASIHEVGLQEVTRIETGMTTILEHLGYEGFESAPRMLQEISRKEGTHYSNTDEGRAECLEDYQHILSEINQKLAPVFGIRPKAVLKVERVPGFREKTSANAYYQMPDLGGKRPGIFFANLRDMNDIHKYGMKTLAYHEGNPGHHFQIAIAMELRGIPFFRRLVPFTAYAEGWALYAEKLACEQGAYQDDPLGELGYLDSELFRAVRLVVDTGIHQMRWTRQQAIDYMLGHTAASLDTIISEIERYIVMPGQACSYKIGEIKLAYLREKCKELLGEKFELHKFHDIVLKNGAMPLFLLEKLVDDFIQAELKSG
jgi:uncharacterized protein (DUF885 family)